MQAVRSIKPTVKNEVMRMKRKYKLAATLDVFAALCLFASMVYLLFFAFAVFPKIAMPDTENASSLGEAFGVALGSAFAITIVITILTVIGGVGAIFAIFAFISALICKRFVRTDWPDSRGGYIVLQIISMILQIASCLTIFAMAHTFPSHYSPCIILCCATLILLVLGVIAKVIALRPERRAEEDDE